ncbi:MAG: hypothetical protein K2Z81_18010 [Cyanobacteria bacterium]|nr:hypothetical protein [Cyanobacteriota bacterium]
MQPGFALIRLAKNESSIGQRKKIIELKEGLSELLNDERGETLAWFNLTRFDQKNTTKPHRDGAPSESMLILGYEPTLVESRITISDYSRCANELGITPNQFLLDFNPMYEKGLELLAPHTTSLSEFDQSAFQILVINNSVSEFCQSRRLWQGVLHNASVIDRPSPRIINSTCAFPLTNESQESIGEKELNKFLQSSFTDSYI